MRVPLRYLSAFAAPTPRRTGESQYPVLIFQDHSSLLSLPRRRVSTAFIPVCRCEKAKRRSNLTRVPLRYLSAYATSCAVIPAKADPSHSSLASHRQRLFRLPKIFLKCQHPVMLTVDQLRGINALLKIVPQNRIGISMKENITDAATNPTINLGIRYQISIKDGFGTSGVLSTSVTQ